MYFTILIGTLLNRQGKYLKKDILAVGHKVNIRGVKIWAVIAVFSLTFPAFATAGIEASHATVVQMDGDAQALKAGTSDWIALSQDMVLSEGDTLKTGNDTELILELAGEAKTAQLTVRPNTEMSFETFYHEAGKESEQTLLDVSVGGILIQAEKLRGESKFEVKTPTSIAGIRGTIFEVQVSPSGTEI